MFLEIDSELARGGKEFLTISIITEKDISRLHEEKIVEAVFNFKKQLKKSTRIYLGFYELEDHPDTYVCKEKRALLTYLVNKLYEKIK